MSLEIKSKHNPKFKLLKQLLTVKGRKEHGLFIAEGKKFLNLNPKYVFSNDECKDTIKIDEDLFNELSSLENSEGFISVFDIKRYDIDEMLGRTIILDRVQNPNNLGAIIRNMDAFGFKNLILIKGSCDPFSPKAVRASMGSILNIKVTHIDEKDFNKLPDRYDLYAADCSGEDIENFKESDLVKDRVAIILGNESKGISKELISRSKVVKIDIAETLDSLNVAVASGILMYILSR